MPQPSSLQKENRPAVGGAYYSQQLENGRWGIFINNDLIATIGCQDTCQKIIGVLERRLSNQQDRVLQDSEIVNQYFSHLKLRIR